MRKLGLMILLLFVVGCGTSSMQAKIDTKAMIGSGSVKESEAEKKEAVDEVKEKKEEVMEIKTVNKSADATQKKEDVQMSEKKDVIASIETSKGTINVKLFTEEVPLTTANFINLILNGYYDGLNFHRVIDNFMVQAGCPFGTGTGGPGYTFADEFKADLRHDKGGILSMANAGPGTNGSQFFITHVETPWLDNRHSVFGAVVSEKDMDVVNSIVQGDVIVKVTVSGDYQTLLDSQKEEVESWNQTLAENGYAKKDK